MKQVCFWNIPNRWDEGAKEEAESRIVPGWNTTALAQACVNFIASGKPVARMKGSASCRICGEPLGSMDLERNGYVFPQKWEHYITAHSVKPWDEEFLAHVATFGV